MSSATLRKISLYTSGMLLAGGFAAVWDARGWSMAQAWPLALGVITIYLVAVAVPLLIAEYSVPKRGTPQGTITVAVRHSSGNGASGDDASIAVRPRDTDAGTPVIRVVGPLTVQ